MSVRVLPAVLVRMVDAEIELPRQVGELLNVTGARVTEGLVRQTVLVLAPMQGLFTVCAEAATIPMAIEMRTVVIIFIVHSLCRMPTSCRSIHMPLLNLFERGPDWPLQTFVVIRRQLFQKVRLAWPAQFSQSGDGGYLQRDAVGSPG